MKTQLLLEIVFIAVVILINSDFERIYNSFSNFLFGGKGNICRY